MPVYLWDDLVINDLDILNSLIKVMDGLFKFQLSPDLSAKDKISLFSGRVEHVSSEVPYIYDITTAAKEANKKLISSGFDLKIEHAYATKYAIELISNSSDIFKLGNNYPYIRICNNLGDFLFEGIPRSYCYEAAVAKLILCDNPTEAKAVASTSGLQKITEELFIEKRESPDIIDGVFNFRYESWACSNFANPIVVVKPERIEDYHTTDELSIILTLIHCLGRFYSIVRSMNSVSASLEVSSWSMSNILSSYEAEFCWIQRNFQNIEKKLYEFEKKAREVFSFWARPFESKVKVYREYGEEFLELEWSSLQTVLEDDRFQKYYTKSDSNLEQLIINEIKEFSRQLSDFWSEFNKVSSSWKENRRSTIEHHQLLLSLIGIFAAIVSDIVLRLFTT